MKNKKIITIIIAILGIILLGLCIYFGVKTSKIKKYTTADEYEVGGEKIESIKAVVGEKKIKSYKHEKTNIDTLKLHFVDSNKEETIKKYMDSLKDNGNYIEMNMSESNKRKIANPSKELITVETEIIEGGFILTIEVGPGSIKVNNPE